jgi:hypothetical protein
MVEAMTPRPVFAHTVSHHPLWEVLQELGRQPTQSPNWLPPGPGQDSGGPFLEHLGPMGWE